MRLLLIEDDLNISDSLASLLKDKRFGVDQAFTKAEGWDKAFVEDYDLIILDWMLPDGSGADLCADLRREKLFCPILMLTAKGMVEDIESGLDAGADDYLTKPFEIRELLARIRALSRRKEGIVPQKYTYKSVEVDTLAGRVIVGGEEIILSPKEFALLEYLLRNKERIMTRDELSSHIWDEESDIASNIVEVYISFLRKKIDNRFGLNFIKTIRGKGYAICTD